MEIKVAPVRNKAGKVVVLRWLIRNITEQKEAELLLQQVNEHLEKVGNSIKNSIVNRKRGDDR